MLLKGLNPGYAQDGASIDYLVTADQDTVFGKIKYGNASFASGVSWVTVKRNTRDQARVFNYRC